MEYETSGRCRTCQAFGHFDCGAPIVRPVAQNAYRARVWTYRTHAIVAPDEHEARMLLTNQALRHVPEASVEILSMRHTPTGRWSAVIRRERR